MSWLWGSSKPTPVSSTAQDASPTSSKAAVTKADIDFSSETDIPSQPVSQEEQEDPALMELLKAFQVEEEKAKGRRIQAKESGQSGIVPIPDDISPDSLYPTEIACRSALDYAMFCQSFGGQFVNVYRYGQFRSCSNHWSDFWLCMRTRNWDEKDRKKSIQDHYRQKAIKWKTGPSSEDVWQVRDEPVKDAFQDNLEELEARIAEWKKTNPTAPDPWVKQSGTTFNNPAPASS